MPDKTIFKDINTYSYDILATRLRELSFLNKGITITITDMRNKDEEGNFVNEEFHSKEGLVEFIKFLDEKSNL